MLTNEDMLAISQLLDVKLKPIVSQIDERFEKVDQRFEAIDRRFEVIDRRFDDIDKRFEAIDKRFEENDKQFKAINARLLKLENGLAETNRLIKEDIIPRLDHIESCYVSTYERYAKEADKIAALDTDMEIA